MVKQAVKDTPIMVGHAISCERSHKIVLTLFQQVMIRPRVGDFLYSDLELEVMLEDIRTLRDYGIRGFVVGILTRDGRVDIDRMRKSGN